MPVITCRENCSHKTKTGFCCNESDPCLAFSRQGGCDDHALYVCKSIQPPETPEQQIEKIKQLRDAFNERRCQPDQEDLYDYINSL